MAAAGGMSWALAAGRALAVLLLLAASVLSATLLASDDALERGARGECASAPRPRRLRGPRVGSGCGARELATAAPFGRRYATPPPGSEERFSGTGVFVSTARL